jgi:hypothetical protein
LTRDPFQIVGDSLAGHGLSFDIATIVTSETIDPTERRKRLTEIAEVSYRDGRAAALLSWDDRFDLHAAVEVLRSLAVVVGPPTGDRHRRAADIIARLLQEQERSEGV